MRQLLFLWIFFLLLLFSPLFLMLPLHVFFACLMVACICLRLSSFIFIHFPCLFFDMHDLHQSIISPLILSSVNSYLLMRPLVNSIFHLRYLFFNFKIYSVVFFMNSISVLIFSTWCDIAITLLFISLITVPLIP